MSGISKSERLDLWLGRLNRLAGSSLTVAEFCLGEGISVPSLYQWKRKLSPRVDCEKEVRPAKDAVARSGLPGGGAWRGGRTNGCGAACSARWTIAEFRKHEPSQKS